MSRETVAAHVMLLRGINVGGKNKLPMRDLSAMFTMAGCQEAQTYIQSGNVAFTAGPQVTARLPHLISTGIQELFGYRVATVARSVEELRDVVRGNPFLVGGADPAALHVAFLADTPDRDRVEQLDADRSPPDAFQVRGREIFLRCPNGLARTRLTNDYFDSRLVTTCTVRNWRTVVKLLEMAESLAENAKQ